MNRPPFKTRLAGHPMIALPMTIAALGSGYATWADIQAWPLAALMLPLAGWSLEANTVMARYKAWKRQWEDLAPAKASHAPANRKPWAVGVMIAATFAYVAAHADQPSYGFALGWMVIGLAVLVAAMLWRKRRPRRAPPNDLATVIIRRPLMPVPSLQEAYRRLPPYCLRLLGIGQ